MYKSCLKKEARLRLASWICGAFLSIGAVNASAESQWMTLAQPDFDLIYPDNMEAEARRVAAMLTDYLEQHKDEMPLTNGKRLPVILYNEAHIANGNVTVFPFRSQWYNQPEPFSRLSWYDSLAVHEGRHIIQLQQLFDTPQGKVAAAAFGELGWSSLYVLTVPMWFVEGDAVVSETTLTTGGRGRVAAFDLWFRTDTLTHDPYSYDRAMLGTNFERYPTLGPYVLGYFLTADMRREHGFDVFERIHKHVGGLPGTGFTFNGATRRETGKSLAGHYDDMIERMRAAWRAQQNSLTITPVDTVWEPDGDNWKSLYPVGWLGGQLWAVEIDVAEGTYLVTVGDDSFERQRALPLSTASSYAIGGKAQSVFLTDDRVCWIESLSHIRFSETRADADLFCWLPGGDVKRLTRGMDLTYAGSDGDVFLVNQYDEAHQSRLMVLNDNGDVLERLELPARSLAYDISATGPGSFLFVLASDEGQSIVEWQRGEPSYKTLFGPVLDETLRAPRMTDHWLYYTSDRTGIDSLWAIGLRNGQRYLTMQRPYGNYFPVFKPGERSGVMTDYTPNGQQLISIQAHASPTAPQTWVALGEVKTQPVDWHDPLIVKEPGVNVTPVTDPAEPYNRHANLWNPHSWSVLYDGSSVVGSLQSADPFSLLTTVLTVGYHLDEEAALAGADFSYSGFWPVINTSLRQYVNDEDAVAQLVSLSTTLPLQQRKNGGFWRMAPAIGWSVERTDDETNPYVTAQWQGDIGRQSAPRDLMEPWLLSTQVTSQAEIDGGVQSLQSAVVRVPGVFNQHYLTGSGHWQYRDDAAEIDPLLTEVPTLDTALRSDSLGRLELDYTAHLAAVGYPVLGPVAYLRTLSWSTGLVTETSSDDSWNSAVSVSLRGAFNLFRNTNLRVSPGVSAFYNLDSEETSVVATFALGGG